MSTTTHEAGTTVHVNPATLLLARNIREATPTPALVKSVKDVGVLEPITAVTTEDGALLVRYGHRRTLAAIEAGRDSVPVYIAGPDSTEATDEILRIIAQRDENTHRSGLTTAEEIGVVAQLTAFGLSPAQVAKKARISRTEVDTALTVAASTLARKATERYEALDLEQAAVVAEFEDDPESVKALIAAAGTGQFAHVAQRARDNRTEARLTEQVREALAEAALTVVERPSYDDKATKALRQLAVSDTDRTRLDEVDHTECPGHVAWLDWDWAYLDADGNRVEFPDEPDDNADETAWDTYEQACEELRATARNTRVPAAAYGCQNWRKNGHADPYGGGSGSKPKAEDMSEEEREAAKQARALVIENNKAWAAAQPVRRDWIATTLAKAKTSPKGTGRFLAVALSTDAHLLGDIGGNKIAAEWLGTRHEGYGRADLAPAKTATESRATVVALVQVLGYYEASLGDRAWRENGTHNAAGRYLRFLKDAGYTLSDVEKYAASNKTA